MDSYHHQSNWYPSSSPPPPPPGGGGGYSHPNPNPNPHLPYPHIPHHQQWPPPSENYLHHQHQQFQPPPPPPPPYHGHPMAGLPPRYPVPPPPAGHMQPHSYPPMPPIPPRPHHSFPPPSQAWGNPSWTQHQGREYPERSIPYNNEEDWAARARAWAASKSGTENHHVQSHFSPIGRADEHSYAYHDQYQQAVDSRIDVQQPSHPQSSVQHLPNTATDPQRQVNNLHVSAPFNSGSSYDIGYNAEATATNTDHMASPQKNYVPSSSIYEQEVPYSYSSAPGNRGAVNQNKVSNMPLPLPMASIQEGHHLLSSLPLQMSSAEQPHFPHHGQRADFLPDARDRPLEFESRPSSDYESHENLSYGHSGPAGVMGVMDHDAHVSPISSWNTAAATGVGYPQIPLAPTGTQFDSSFISQVHPAPSFGRIPPPSFQPNLPPVSAPFGLGPGSSLHHPAGFPGDTNGGLNLSERPKKAAVPNWLREEIIKKKAVLPSTVPMQSTGNSLYSIGPDDADKSLRRADQADSRSIDSNKSEDEEDDEEDVEAAKSAAINQEIKRVLTEVLLKVTDELFDEIATKVLDEEQIVEVEENAVVGKQVSSPPAISTLKASTKILVPFKMENDKVNGFTENSSTSSPGRDILGLGNYASDASDDDVDDEIRSPSLLSSGNKVGASHEPENNEKSFQNDLSSEGNREHPNGPTEKKSASSYMGNQMTEKGSSAADNLIYEKASLGASTVCEETVLADSGKVNELPSVNGNSYQPDHNVGEKTGRGQESTSGHANHDKFVNRDYQDRECKSNLGPDKNPVVTEIKDNMYKTRREISDKNDSVSHEDRSKLKDKLNKREKAKERTGDRSSDRRANAKESDLRRSSKHNSSMDDRKEAVKDKRERDKEAGERKRERGRDEKEDRSTRDSKSSSRYTSRRSPTPSSRGKNSKDNSVSYGSASGDEPSDNSRKRMQQSVNSSLSPSPTKSRKRQVSRSPPSKHSHRRHSPYPSSERRRRRERSISPVHQKRSSAHKHER